MAASQTDQFDRRVLELINQERAKLKLKPLSLSEKLDTAADLHSKDMALNDYFSHTGKDRSSPGTRIQRSGYTQWTTWGENIAAGQTTAESVVQGWMNSPGHRANILNPTFTHMGLGYTFLANDTGRVNYRHYWTQVFAAGDPNPGQYATQSSSLQTNSLELFPQLSTALEGASNEKVYGEVGDTLLTGGKGNDTLVGGNGNEVLVGNGGSDLFILAKDGGTDSIADFQNELDLIGLAGGLTFGQIILTQSGTDTLIREAKSTEILASLTGINTSAIDASDFIQV